MLYLPEEKRKFFKAPFGTLYPDISNVLPLIKGVPVYSVGDVVTYRLTEHGVVPDIAVIDGHTMRSPCDRSPLINAHRISVTNPAGTLSDELLEGLRDALEHTPALVCVEGEEDLAVIPLVMIAPEGAIILYGQPGEGLVLRIVDPPAKQKAREMFSCFEDRS
ncbi:MAG TPA: GTP-dependent dephospho-CoA kinase family protein [Methanoregulaceae archaeon]|nr:GTP-dependent dephospho-CoA kinase family protein [Methanoregulaceae archaeon]